MPTSATTVLINVTATNTSAAGWLQVFPTNRAAVGSSSTLNLDVAGQTLPNASFAPLGDRGRLTVHATFATDVIVDVFGYFEPVSSATSGRLVTVAPTRILDTRRRLGWAPTNPGDVKDCADFATPADAQLWYEAHVDLFGDVARLDTDGDGIVCEPTDRTPTPPVTPPPPPATPPANPGDTKNCGDFATYAEAKAWFDQYFPLYGDVARLDSDGNGIPCESLPGSPTRLIDALATDRSNAKVLAGTTLTLQVAGRGGVPTTGASAVILNVTAVGPLSEGWVQVAPTPVSVGESSNLNTRPGVTAANLVVVPISASGTVDLHSTTGGDLLADVFGYFTDATADPATVGLFVPMTPERVLDSRAVTGSRGVGAGVATGVNLAPWISGALAITGNLTSTNSSADGFLQLAAVPITIGAHSNLNTAYDGQTVANAVVTPLNTGSTRVEIYTLYNADVLLDITGYFTTG